jgi:hypothetical protein
LGMIRRTGGSWSITEAVSSIADDSSDAIGYLGT